LLNDSVSMSLFSNITLFSLSTAQSKSIHLWPPAHWHHCQVPIRLLSSQHAVVWYTFTHVLFLCCCFLEHMVF
jgi:hypothetical protein